MTESTSHVEQQIQARIQAARIRVQAAQRRRDELSAARRRGLAARHTQKLRTTWPSRDEWQASAERDTRTRMLPTERVSDNPADYLTPAQLQQLHDEADAVLSATWRTLGAVVRQMAGDARTQAQSRRRMVNRVRSVVRDPDATVTALVGDLRLVRNVVAEYGPDAGMLYRLAERLEVRRGRAAREVEERAVREEVARRSSDAGWVAELERRARVEQRLSGRGVVSP